MRQYVIASLLIIFGLICIALSESGSIPTSVHPYLSELSSALLVGGLLGLLFKIFQEREQDAKLRKLFRIHDSIDKLGLVEIMPEVQAYNFTKVIEDSNHLQVVMNDGLRWVGNNTISLTNRFNKANASTEFFIVNPDSEFVPILAKKVNYSPGDLKTKIRKAWSDIDAAFNKSRKCSGYKIYGINTFPTRSLFLSDNELIETPYQISSGKARIPLYIFRKINQDDSLYAFAKHDIDQLRNESTLIKEVGAN